MLLPYLHLKCVCNTNECRIKNFALHHSLFISLYGKKKSREQEIEWIFIKLVNGMFLIKDITRRPTRVPTRILNIAP